MRVWLKNLRTEKQMTLKELADKLDISESYCCAIETGTRQKSMDLTLIAGLSVVFGVPIAQIVEYELELIGATCTS